MTSNGDGTATISGSTSVTGFHAVSIVATNGATATAQRLLITLNEAPIITTANSATAHHGTAFGFVVRSVGYPVAAITESGSLPKGVAFTPAINGTATIHGVPGATSAGTYTLSITATHSKGSVTQTFTLAVT